MTICPDMWTVCAECCWSNSVSYGLLQAPDADASVHVRSSEWEGGWGRIQSGRASERIRRSTRAPDQPPFWTLQSGSPSPRRLLKSPGMESPWIGSKRTQSQNQSSTGSSQNLQSELSPRVCRKSQVKRNYFKVAAVHNTINGFWKFVLPNGFSCVYITVYKFPEFGIL